MDELSASRYIMSIIVSSCQHCDEQQFRTLSKLCTLQNFFSSRKLDLLLLNHILALKKLRVRHEYILLNC